MSEQAFERNPMAIGEEESAYSTPKLVKLESLLTEEDKLQSKNLFLIAVQELSGQVVYHRPNDEVYSNVRALRDSNQQLIGVRSVHGG